MIGGLDRENVTNPAAQQKLSAITSEVIDKIELVKVKLISLA
jgi:hypothetical protein